MATGGRLCFGKCHALLFSRLPRPAAGTELRGPREVLRSVHGTSGPWSVQPAPRLTQTSRPAESPPGAVHRTPQHLKPNTSRQSSFTKTVSLSSFRFVSMLPPTAMKAAGWATGCSDETSGLQAVYLSRLRDTAETGCRLMSDEHWNTVTWYWTHRISIPINTSSHFHRSICRVVHDCTAQGREKNSQKDLRDGCPEPLKLNSHCKWVCKGAMNLEVLRRLVVPKPENVAPTSEALLVAGT